MFSLNRIAKRFISLALAASGPLAFGAMPASATIASPATVFTYDSEATGQAGWSNVLGYSSANDNSAWGNFVNDQPAGGSGVGAVAVKAHMGNGAVSNTAVGSIASTDSLIGAGTMTASISFWAPAAGKVVSMALTDSNYGNAIAVNASATTVVGWQKLYFDFTTPTTGTYSSAIAYSKANIDYDTASQVTSADFYFDNAAFNGGTNYPLVPSTNFNYESNTAGMNGWANMLGYTSANDNSAWGNYVDSATGLPAGGSAGTIGVKAHMGNATSNIAVGSIADGSSLISDADKTVTMNFWSPAAGKTVALVVTDNNYGNAVVKTATAASQGWQVLTFDFATPTSGSFSSSISYNRANMVYDFGHTGASTDFYFDDVAFNGATSAALVPVNNGPSITSYRIALDSADRKLDPAGTTEFLACSWWCDNVTHPYVRYMTKGQTFVLDYTVTDQSSNPVANASVDLAVTVPDNNVTWTAGGTAYTTQTLNGTTDSSGHVSFTVINTNTNSENRRADLTQWTDPAGNTNYKWEFKPSIHGAAQGVTQDVDWIWGHVVSDQLPQNVPATAQIRLKNVSKQNAFLTPAAWGWAPGHCCNQSANDTIYLKYLTYGESYTLSYNVTGANNAPMANTTVTVTIAGAATWTVGGVVKNAGSTLTGTTDSSGDVSFTLVNTTSSASAESARRNLGEWSDNTSGLGDVVGDFKASVGAITETRDTMWLHITQPPVTSGNYGAPNIDKDNKGKYVHIRLDKSLLNNSFDASWWDGIWQYRDADTRAYVKYIPVRSTFALTYVVTDENQMPMANQDVSLIVNANYSCSKATFSYGSIVVPRDNCAGGGETVLPAKKTDGNGRVTFVLTNTNAKGEATPSNLNAPPSVGAGNEIGTNIKPHVADKEAVDMLLAHFVEPAANAPTISGSASDKVGAYAKKALTYTVKDSKGAPLAGATVQFVTNGVGTVSPFGVTDKSGQVTAWASNAAGVAGVQTVSAVVDVNNGLPVSSVTQLTWSAPVAAVTTFGDRKSVLVTVTDAKGKSVKITISGLGTFTRRMASANEQFQFPTSVGAKTVTTVLDGKTKKTVVKVTK